MSILTRRNELILLLAITLLAAWLRLFRLEALPPGDGHDVAQYGVDALQILRGARPIFLESNFGREALFSYLVALAFAFVGPSTFAIHLTSAIAGIATVPAVYLAARELFYEERDGLLGYLPLLAALLAAISYWHLNWSRVGYRVILVPLLAALIFFALWRGFRNGGRFWYGLSGALLGLSLYTYQAARLLPILFIAAWILRALQRRRWSRTDTANLLLSAALAVLVFAPMGIYAWQHPGALSVRIRQAAVIDPERPLADQAGELIAQATTALLTYSFTGDSDPQFTLVGRPSLNPFLSIGFYAGILLALWRWRRSPYVFLLLWLALLTAPAMVADQAATAKRYLGAFPAVMMLISAGFLAPLEWLRWRDESTVGRREGIMLYALALAAGLVYSTATTTYDYFVRWAADPDLPAHFQADHKVIGEAIGQLDAQQTVWLSPYVPDHPVIQFHAGLRPDLRGYNGRFCTPFQSPVAGSGATYFIVPGFQDNSLAQLQTLFPTGRTAEGLLRPSSDQPYYRSFAVAAGDTVPDVPEEPLASWNEGMALLAGTVEPQSAAAGDSVTVTLIYRADGDPAADYTAFVHLLGQPRPDTGSPLWAQADSEPCGGTLPTGRWRAGDLIRDTIQLTLPPDIAEGEYELLTGFYSWPDLTRLIARETGGDTVRLGTIRVGAPPGG